MEVVTIDITKLSEKIIKKAVDIIKQGGVVAFPTDTAYGLAAGALDERAIGKLFIIKQRIQKPLPVIVDSIEMLETVAVATPDEKKIMKKYWPGALTIILKKKPVVPPFLTLGLPTIGIRIPDSAIALQLIKAYGKPLTSTSANISGKGNCYAPECVTRMFQDSESQPDLILDGGELPEVPVSSVIQVEGGKVKVLREGPVHVKIS